MQEFFFKIYNLPCMDFPPTSLTAHPFRSELTARAYHQDLGGRGGSTSRILVRDGSIGVTVFKYKCSTITFFNKYSTAHFNIYRIFRCISRLFNTKNLLPKIVLDLYTDQNTKFF